MSSGCGQSRRTASLRALDRAGAAAFVTSMATPGRTPACWLFCRACAACCACLYYGCYHCCSHAHHMQLFWLNSHICVFHSTHVLALTIEQWIPLVLPGIAHAAPACTPHFCRTVAVQEDAGGLWQGLVAGASHISYNLHNQTLQFCAALQCKRIAGGLWQGLVAQKVLGSALTDVVR